MINFALLAGEELAGRYIGHILTLAKLHQVSPEKARLIVLVEPARLPRDEISKLVTELGKKIKRVTFLAISKKRTTLPIKAHYFKRPFTAERLISFVEELFSCHLPLSTEERTQPFIGEDPKIAKIRDFIPTLAEVTSPILLWGAKGVGKELLARHIHGYHGGKFIKFSPQALPEEMIEPILFGFTGNALPKVKRKKDGLFKKAANGILYIENLDFLPLSAQQKLLGFIEAGMFYPLGAKEPVKTSTKLIVSLSKAPEQVFKEQKILREIFFRLMEFAIYLPPLRERLIDLPLLAQHFLEHYAWIYRKEVPELSENFFKHLLLHPWTKNIAELEEVIKETIIWGEEKVLAEHFKKKPKIKFKIKNIEKILEKLFEKEKSVKEQIESSRKDQASRRTGSR
ncbi:sigma-54-dependent transcriptional regulator [Thermodesulfatator atlanticus]|uniref:sigma-54-dependent transcriptional regulator n=1 Tax=Thermodesulfatator atlanticus TaxID=501497 RepID=UPI0003B37952|nr:sigma 54-interacting transcriptional regulator [Thermodesulfatator atlanticus]